MSTAPIAYGAIPVSKWAPYLVPFYERRHATRPAPVRKKRARFHHTVTIAPDLVPPFDDEYRAMRALHTIGVQRFGSGVSYAYCIMPNGRVYQGMRSDTKQTQSGHTVEANYDELGVAFVGNYDDAPLTAAQIAAASKLLADEHKAGRLESIDPNWHKQVYATACPGKFGIAAMPAIATEAKRILSVDVPDRDKPRGPKRPVMATYNCPSGLGVERHEADLAHMASTGVGLFALQEVGDSRAVSYAKHLGWDWWRPEKARSAALIFNPDLWEPVRNKKGRRKQGAFRINAKGANDRFIVWAVLRYKPTGKQYRIGSVHIPAFKTRSPKRARQFRHAEHRAAEWLSRGPRRVLAGDFNADKSRLWTPNLNAVARWEKPRLATHGVKKIDHVVASNRGRIAPKSLSTFEGAPGDHRALIVRL